ncbi:MAG: S-layer family protein, partial [Calothrix sp. MO_192.B10]|nr:S-layer family protein [Calothrix sp. MO_192.B10]
IFGPNARLDVAGSFFASTSDSFIFDNGFEFSASNPQAPPLLTVNMPVGLRFRDNPGSITNEGATLALSFGKTLALIGGDVNFDGATIGTLGGGKVEIGGLAKEGVIRIDNDFNLSFPENIEKSNVLLKNASGIGAFDLSGIGGTSIAINAKNIEILEGSNIFLVPFASGTSTVQGGNIVINATNKLMIQGDAQQQSNIANVGIASDSATVIPGDVIINTSILEGNGNYLIGSLNLGLVSSNSGNVVINAKKSVSLRGGQIQSSVGLPGDTGNARDTGNISIKTSSLLLNGAQLNTSTSGEGKAGSVNIQVENGDVNLTNSSRIVSKVESTGKGDAGDIDIDIKSGNLSITNGTQILSTVDGINFDNSGNFTIGEGNGGKITINVDGKINLDGANDSGLPSLISTSLGSGANFLSSDVGVQKKAGDIKITAGELSITNGAQINSSTSGLGNAGRVDIQVANGSVTLTNSSSIFSNVEPFTVGESVFSAIGNAGEIDIKAGELSIINGSAISSSTFGQGNAGRVSIQVENGDITLANSSNIFSNVETDGIGNAGEISLTAKNIFLRDGSQLQSAIKGKGDGTKISLVASGEVSLTGFSNIDPVVDAGNIGDAGTQDFFTSAIFSNVAGGEGNAGEINIQAGTLSLSDGAQINSSTFGIGNAGTISVTVDDSINLAKTSFILSIVDAGGRGIGGDINLTGRSLTATDGSQIGTSVVRAINNQPPGIGKAGNIDVNMTDFINIVGFSETGFSSALLASGEIGTTATESKAAGDITVTTGDFRIADGAIVIASTENPGDGGIITINARNFSAINGAKVVTSTSNAGKAGDIKLNIDDRITIAGIESNFDQRLAILEQAGEDVDFDRELGPASGIFANTSTNSTGDGGNIDIDPKTVEILDGAKISADSRGAGKPGNINIVSDELLLLRRGGTISTNSTQDTDGGNITIKTGVLVALPKENSDITSNAVQGTGGRINITAQGIFGIVSRDSLTNLSDITANSEFGISGTISINNPEVDPENGLVELPETVVDAENQIAQNPCQQGFGSSFVATGRGGLPPNPSLDLSTGAVRVGLATPVASKITASNTTASQPKSTPKAKKFVPAQGWVFNSKGQVVLTAYDPNSIGVQRTSHKGLCRAR